MRPGGHVRCSVFLFSLEERGEKGERGRIVERAGRRGREMSGRGRRYRDYVTMTESKKYRWATKRKASLSLVFPFYFLLQL